MHDPRTAVQIRQSIDNLLEQESRKLFAQRRFEFQAEIEKVARRRELGQNVVRNAVGIVYVTFFFGLFFSGWPDNLMESYELDYSDVV